MSDEKCPHCGTGQADRLEYECGTKTYGHIRGESCYEDEIEKLREKKANGLEWKYITCDLYEARGFSGVWSLLYDSQVQSFSILLDGELVKETATRIIRDAKAHAEELHQQAWRELRERWDAV